MRLFGMLIVTSLMVGCLSSPPTPTATPTLTETPASSPTPSQTPTSTITPTPSNTPTPTITPSPTTPPAYALSQIGVTANAEWAPYAEEIDGVLMALVPAGCFELGTWEGQDDEWPANEQCFERPFWMDVYEVTNAAYGEAACVGFSSADDQPRVCVTWFAAADHCAARGARLPTEAEWEYAVRGPDGLVYPWGNEFVDFFTVDDPALAPVGSHPETLSWVGVHDLIGSVWEWTSTQYLRYPYRADDGRENPDLSLSAYRVLRGGGTWPPTDWYVLRAMKRTWDNPLTLGRDTGFRCVRGYARD